MSVFLTILAAGLLAAVQRHLERLAQLRPRALTAEFAGAAGTLAIVAMLALDCLINDLAPTRHKLRCMLRWRPAALMAAAFGDLGMCGAFLATFPGDWAYLLRFFPLAAFLTALAFLDTFARGVFDGH